MAELVYKKIIINDQPDCEFVPLKKKKKTLQKSTLVRPQTVSLKSHSKDLTGLVTAESSCSVSVGECDILTCQLPEDLSYQNLLLIHKAVNRIDELAYVVQDLEVKTSLLKDDFVIVRRRPYKSKDGFRWLYTCSCNDARKSVFDSISSLDLDFTEEDLDDSYRKCFHIAALEKFEHKFPDVNIETEYERLINGQHNYIAEHAYERKCVKTEIYSVPNHKHVLCVRQEHGSPLTFTYSVIKMEFTEDKPVLKCSSCPRKANSHNCKHIESMLEQNHQVSDISKEFISLLNYEPRWRSKYLPSTMSSRPIPFYFCKMEGQRLCLRMGEMTSLYPEVPDTPCCGAINLTEPLLVEEAEIISENGLFPAQVFLQKCLSCHSVHDYDGRDDQLVNMGRYLVDHKILRKYLRQFVTEGTPMISFYQELCWSMIEFGFNEFQAKFGFSRFRYAWYSFLNLLDPDYCVGFSCPECGPTPSTVVMDGVTLGLRKKFLDVMSPLQTDRQSNEILDGSSHNTRVFVNNVQARKLLKQLTFGLNKLGFIELKKLITLYEPSLLKFLEELENFGEGYICPEIYKELMTCLSSNYPVCAHIHYNEKTFEILTNAVDNDSPPILQDVQMIEKECPLIAQLLSKWKWKVPLYMRPILLELVLKARSPFKIPVHCTGVCPKYCSCAGVGLFPNLPLSCHRGDYVLDNRNPRSTEVSCKKKGSMHPSLIPGLFTVSCYHGICYGFQLMEDVESPNIAFTILRTRFATAPRLIVYDNACNLHNYCLNRDPTFFRDSWFLVDRFHWSNHVGCHIGYRMSSYYQLDGLNSQVAEQRNSTLKKLKAMLSYMNLDNFFNHLKLFLWFRNMIHIYQLDPKASTENDYLFKSLLPIYSRLK